MDLLECAVEDYQTISLHMSRFRAFWGIVWEYHYDLLHHEIHDHIYVTASGPKGGSLRSTVIDCLIAIGDFVDRLTGLVFPAIDLSAR